MDWFKKHGDTIIILGSFALCFWHLNEKINTVEKDLTIIKTVLIMKNIIPDQLASTDKAE